MRDRFFFLIGLFVLFSTVVFAIDVRDYLCDEDSDCGADQWVGQASCFGGDSWQEYRSYRCDDPGTKWSSCSYTQIFQMKEQCFESCGSGICKEALCSEDLDCGYPGFVNEPFCKGLEVWQDYRFFECRDPDTDYAVCKTYITAKKKRTCSEYCSAGVCVYSTDHSTFMKTEKLQECSE